MPELFEHDHFALVVKDLAATREFYEYLGGRVVSSPSMAFMEIVLGAVRLHVLPADTRSRGSAPVSGPRFDHVCLRVRSVEELERLQRRLNAHPSRSGRPCAIEDSPPLGQGTHLEERPPRKTLYFEDPDGLMLEVRAYEEPKLDQPASSVREELSVRAV